MDGQISKHLMDSTSISCENCESVVFEQKTVLRRISRILLASDKDQIIPIPVVVCSSCGHINEEFIPKFPNDKKA